MEIAMNTIRNINIPDEIINKWQSIVNILAKIISVPAALITKVDTPYLEIFCSSESNSNPYKAGHKAPLESAYCGNVIKTGNEVLIPNAMKDENLNKNPNIKLGMISYLGFPIKWPTGDIFGTICVLDLKENNYGEVYKKLLFESKELIEAQLHLLYQNIILEKTANELEKSLNEIKVLHGLLPICCNCKKIRDDKGYWSQIEIYFRNHSGVEFSHGICPECVKKLYPDLENEGE